MIYYQKAALVILTIALAWPPIHMILSSKNLFSAWRFFGWGMYSEISPIENKKLIIIDSDAISNEKLLGCTSHLREVIFCSERAEEPLKVAIINDIIFSHEFPSAFRRYAFFNRIDLLRHLLLRNRIDGFDPTRYKIAMGIINIDETSKSLQLHWSIIKEDRL